jgi:Ribonuclease G/E
MVRFIDKNERSHQAEARKQLKRHAQLDGLATTFKQHVISDEQQLLLISE